jgi:hypothetical protein
MQRSRRGFVLAAIAVLASGSCGVGQTVVNDTCFGRAFIIEPSVIEVAVGDSIRVIARLNRDLQCLPGQPTNVTWRVEPPGLLAIRRVDDSTVVASALMAGDAAVVVTLVSDPRLREAFSVKVR